MHNERSLQMAHNNIIIFSKFGSHSSIWLRGIVQLYPFFISVASGESIIGSQRVLYQVMSHFSDRLSESFLLGYEPLQCVFCDSFGKLSQNGLRGLQNYPESATGPRRVSLILGERVLTQSRARTRFPNFGGTRSRLSHYARERVEVFTSRDFCQFQLLTHLLSWWGRGETGLDQVVRERCTLQSATTAHHLLSPERIKL